MDKFSLRSSHRKGVDLIQFRIYIERSLEVICCLFPKTCIGRLNFLQLCCVCVYVQKVWLIYFLLLLHRKLDSFYKVSYLLHPISEAFLSIFLSSSRQRRCWLIVFLSQFWHMHLHSFDPNPLQGFFSLLFFSYPLASLSCPQTRCESVLYYCKTLQKVYLWNKGRLAYLTIPDAPRIMARCRLWLFVRFPCIGWMVACDQGLWCEKGSRKLVYRAKLSFWKQTSWENIKKSWELLSKNVPTMTWGPLTRSASLSFLYLPLKPSCEPRFNFVDFWEHSISQQQQIMINSCRLEKFFLEITVFSYFLSVSFFTIIIKVLIYSISIYILVTSLLWSKCIC